MIHKIENHFIKRKWFFCIRDKVEYFISLIFECLYEGISKPHFLGSRSIKPHGTLK
jgi:hypothetical protein